MAVGQFCPPADVFRVFDRTLNVLIGMPRAAHPINLIPLLTIVKQGLFIAEPATKQ